MLGIGIVLSIFGLGFFCWLLFTLAVYALPFLGLSAGLAVFHSGAGVVGGLVVGFLVGGAILALGQIAFATTRTPLIRVIIGLLYAVPAAVAGYQVLFAWPVSACRTADGRRHSPWLAPLSPAARPSRVWRCLYLRRPDRVPEALTRPLTGGCTTRADALYVANYRTGWRTSGQ